jgi:hypothetical protein
MTLPLISPYRAGEVAERSKMVKKDQIVFLKVNLFIVMSLLPCKEYISFNASVYSTFQCFYSKKFRVRHCVSAASKFLIYKNQWLIAHSGPFYILSKSG